MNCGLRADSASNASLGDGSPAPTQPQFPDVLQGEWDLGNVARFLHCFSLQHLLPSATITLAGLASKQNANRETDSYSQLVCHLQLDFQLDRMLLPRQTDIAGYSPKLLIQRSKK